MLISFYIEVVKKKVEKQLQKKQQLRVWTIVEECIAARKKDRDGF